MKSSQRVQKDKLTRVVDSSLSLFVYRSQLSKNPRQASSAHTVENLALHLWEDHVLGTGSIIRELSCSDSVDTKSGFQCREVSTILRGRNISWSMCFPWQDFYWSLLPFSQELHPLGGLLGGQRTLSKINDTEKSRIFVTWKVEYTQWLASPFLKPSSQEGIHGKILS